MMIIHSPLNTDNYVAAVDALVEKAKQFSKENKRLRSALKQFCDSYEPHLSPERCQNCSEAYWEARAALKGSE